MVDIIIKKPFERIDWKDKLGRLSPKDAQAWQIAEYRRCVEDIPYWFQQYVWTVNTRKTPPVIPFVLYDFQEHLIKELGLFHDIFIEKSRQMGISWTIMGWELHQALYTEGYTALNVSRKESEVQDSGNTFHALMGRIFFIYQKLPPFLRPRVHNPFLTFKVFSTNSIIKGESANPNAGRDTNYKFVLLDEAGHIKCLDEMWKGVRSSSDAICVNSTPPKDAINNKYMELKDMKDSGFKRLKFHWSQHPEKDEKWFEKNTASMTDEEIAQELEIDYDKAQSDRSYPEYSDDMHLLNHKVYINAAMPLYCFMDFGLAGEVHLWAQLDKDQRMFILKYDIYKNLLTHELYNAMLKSLNELGYRRGVEEIVFIGDVAGDKRMRSNKLSVIDEYRRASNGKIKIKTKSMDNYHKMRCVKSRLKTFISGRPQLNISKEPSCIRFSHCMKYLSLNKKRTDHKDNKYTHAVNAFEYGVNHLLPVKRAAAIVVGVDPGSNNINNKNNRHVSATSVVDSHRINRRSSIWH